MEERIAGFISDLAASLPLDQPTTVSRHHLGVVVQQCGQHNISAGLLQHLSAALEKAGICSSPGLHEVGLTRESVLTFSRCTGPTWSPGLTFPDEAALESFLVDHHAAIPALSHLRRPRPQYRLPSGNRVDILFDVVGGEELVVTELKLDRGGHAVAAQPFTYVHELRQIPATASRPMRVLIVTGSPQPSLHGPVGALSSEYKVPVEWWCYRLRVEFGAVFSTPGPAPVATPVAIGSEDGKGRASA